ncbi:hypothetical protein CPB84DRAFT_1692902 [Gymnopilus junonius]|uniref:Sugar phosphate phosphatase n=1 Tax=Gymnopilus junonius TaxID=109634 RepID=A0A9P5TG47_GYMJU|nr:hypothetical protein CPB84DRAFT_1692902 [Gymnopilus junonius]
MPFSPPYPPYDPTDKSGYDTVVKRWPIILTGVVDTLHKASHNLSLQVSAASDADKEDLMKRIEEGKGIIEKVGKLKYEMGRDKPLENIPDDGEPSVALYNAELQALAEDKRNTWFTAPWLFAECYLYRLLRSHFVQTEHWKSYDPFYDQKMNTFQQSGKSIFHIATTMHEIGVGGDDIQSDPEILKVLFNEMIQMCLWGNATDLSLLTHLSQEDIHQLQSVGKEAQAARKKFILCDDEEAVWKHIQTLKDAQFHFVLDNSGFELFTDLVFADFLVTYTPYVAKVVFHPKLIPWFVSDVTPPDFKDTFTTLSDTSFFPISIAHELQSGSDHLEEMISRWKRYLDTGVFSLSVPLDTPLAGTAHSRPAEFWTTPRPYWDMETEAPETFRKSKFQRNSENLYRFLTFANRLTGDIRWPAWTPFAEAIGPLAGAFPLLSLRTNKADVVVGISKEIAEKLDASGEKWRVDGRYVLITPNNHHVHIFDRYALVSFVPKI